MVGIKGIENILKAKDALDLKSLDPNKTVLIIIDVVNGFAKEGPMSSPRITGIVPNIVGIIKKVDKLGIQKLFFGDSHTENSPEFDSYPVHCMVDTWESEVVDEIKELGGYRYIAKNSTNGFIEPEFQRWLDENGHVENFLVVGDCTDICILQFTTTLKAYFNMKNQNRRVIVPIDGVDTYDADEHDGDILHTMALYIMLINGIEIVNSIN